MRLFERTRVDVALAPRVRSIGSTGECNAGFSKQHMHFRGSVLPAEGALDVSEHGLQARERVRVLLPGDVRARVGDALLMGGKRYLIRDVRRWSMHMELDCEAIP